METDTVLAGDPLVSETMKFYNTHFQYTGWCYMAQSQK